MFLQASFSKILICKFDQPINETFIKKSYSLLLKDIRLNTNSILFSQQNLECLLKL